MPAPTLPTPPSSSDPANFVARSDAFLAALPPFELSMIALAAQATIDAATASAAASAATSNGAAQVALATAQVALASAQAAAAAEQAAAADASASLAAATAVAALWVSGATYAIGAAAISPIDFQTYRRVTAGAGTTDPSLDYAGVNWTPGFRATVETPMVGSLIEAVNSSADESTSWVFADGRSLTNSTYPVAATKFPPAITVTTTRASAIPANNNPGVIRTVNGICFKMDGGNLYASSDSGVTWVLQMAAPGGNALSGIAYGNSIFMVTWGNTTTPYKSTTGMSGWATVTALPNNFASTMGGSWSTSGNIAFGAGVFVIVGNGTTATTGYTSADGVVWTARTVDGSVTQPHRVVVWCGGSVNRFIATTGYETSNSRVASSTDGITWSGATTAFAFNITSCNVATDGTNIVLMAAAGYDATNFCYSTNGTSWSSVSLPASRTWVYSGYAAGKFFAIGYGAGSPNTWYTVTSPTGVTWTETAMTAWPSQTFGSPSFAVNAGQPDVAPICRVGSTWIIPSSQVGFYWLSTDNGATWATQATPTYAAYYWANANSTRFVMSNGSATYYSTNGINWTIAATPPAAGGSLRRIEVANNIFFFISTGSANQSTSPDGNIWTTRTAVCAAAGARTAIYALGVYIIQTVQGASGAGYYTSPDLTTWTARTVGGGLNSYPTSISNIVFDGVKLYCAGQHSDTTRTALTTSTDYINWTTQTALGISGYGVDMSQYWGLCAFGVDQLYACNQSNYGWTTHNGGGTWVGPTGGYQTYNSRARIDGSWYFATGTVLAKVDCLQQVNGPAAQIEPYTLAEMAYGSPIFGAMGNIAVIGFSGYVLRTTADWVTWSTTQPRTFASSGSIPYAAVSDGTNIFIGTSRGTWQTTDGVTYTHKTPWTTMSGASLFYHGGMFHKTESNSQTLSSSTDGVTWTVRKVLPLSSDYFYNVGYANTRWFAATNRSAEFVYSSTDGTTWTANATAPNFQFNNVIYTGGLYVFGGNNLYTTPDLSTWILRYTSFNSAVANPNPSTLSGLTGTTALESKDGGLTWVAAPGSISAASGSTSMRMWGSDVAITNQGTGAPLHISKNGITYQQFTAIAGAPGANGWKTLAMSGADLYSFTSTATYKFTKSATQFFIPNNPTTRKLVRIK